MEREILGKIVMMELMIILDVIPNVLVFDQDFIVGGDPLSLLILASHVKILEILKV